jgi:hypothetical protein
MDSGKECLPRVAERFLPTGGQKEEQDCLYLTKKDNLQYSFDIIKRKTAKCSLPFFMQIILNTSLVQAGTRY